MPFHPPAYLRELTHSETDKIAAVVEEIDAELKTACTAYNRAGDFSFTYKFNSPVRSAIAQELGRLYNDAGWFVLFAVAEAPGQCAAIILVLPQERPGLGIGR